jgi:hypothetical protein
MEMQERFWELCRAGYTKRKASVLLAHRYKITDHSVLYHCDPIRKAQCKEHIRAWREAHVEQDKANQARYQRAHRKEIRERQRETIKRRYHSDPIYRAELLKKQRAYAKMMRRTSESFRASERASHKRYTERIKALKNKS